jgi:hypothetical protein
VRKAPITDELRNLLEPLINRALLSTRDFEEAVGRRIEKTVDELRGLTTNEDVVTRREAVDALRELVRVIAAMVSVGSIGAMYYDEEEFRAENYGWLAYHSAAFPDWSIVTLNYDTVLDWAFEFLIGFVNSRHQDLQLPRQYLHWRSFIKRIGSRPNTDSMSFDSGMFVKLHGCLEFFSCQNANCKKYRVPYVPDSSAYGRPRFFGLREEQCPSCGENAVELILPPGRNKTRGESLYHDWVYSIAEAVASRSSTWICLGYSCPDYDEDVVDFLKRSLADRNARSLPTQIYAVTPDAVEVANRLGQRLVHRVFAYSSTFTQLVSSARRTGKISK